MDLGLIAAVAMLLFWGVVTFTTEAPGWIHLLLTVGVFLLVWRIVARDDRAPRRPPRDG